MTKEDYLQEQINLLIITVIGLIDYTIETAPQNQVNNLMEFRCKAGKAFDKLYDDFAASSVEIKEIMK